MASLFNIQSEVEDIHKEYYDRNNYAEEHRQKENQAATQIQSWFRACKVRAYLSHLHKKAVIIQKIWRGFTARARFRQMEKAAYFIMKMNFYAEMAVRIQRRWRGFFVRKYIHSFYARKSYLEGLAVKNELVRMELDELEELQRRERRCVERVREQNDRMYQAQRLHHLLSTKQCPGVFNSPFSAAPHEMEQLLRQVKYQAPARLSSGGPGACLQGLPGPTAAHFLGTLGSLKMKTARDCYSSKPILPPIVGKKHQPGEVWQQPVLCPDQTMRLQSSYTHLEEAQEQLRQHQAMYFSGDAL